MNNKNLREKDVVLHIGDYIFDSERGTLVSATDNQDPKPRKLEPQISELLLFFATHPQQLLSRDAITAQLWPGRVVTDDALRAAIKKLREALKDNARDPGYIKTLPLKGYMLIAPVSYQPPARQNRHSKPFLVWVVSALILAVLISSLWLGRLIGSPAESDLSISYLTDMSGSEVSPDYDPVHNRLLFSHRANKDDYLQLYVKDLSSGKTARLTSEQANYAGGLWAPDGKTLLYTRSDIHSQSHYLAGYSPGKGIVRTSPLSTVTNDMYLLSWASNGASVYLKDKFSAGQPQGIWQFHLKNSKLENISAPNVSGHGDIFAKESHNGELLAILRGVEQDKGELLLLHLATGELVHTHLLPQVMHRLVWGPDDNVLTMSNFQGQLMQYQRHDQQLRKMAHNQSYLNNIFYQCADDCFYMRQHSGNYLDLGEQPNPFSVNPLLSSDYYESAGVEDFPVYGPQTHRLYFVSRHQGTLSIKFLDSDKNTQLVAAFPEDSDISALTINQQETMLTGLAGNRVFTVQINSGDLKFITSSIDKNYPPFWTVTGDALIYARLEKNRPVLYRYSLTSEEHVRAETGYLAKVSIDKQRHIMIDLQFNAYLVEVDRSPRLLTRLPAVTPNRWQINGDWLYYTAHKENTALLHRVNIVTGKAEHKELAKNRFRLNFDLNQTRLTVVKSRLADSDLVEVRL
ncbi:winged helix-turn-helix domain-containing protein [Lacimicrobium alkaliphilum]|uniref:OmpR/PhoB-type domain-containing protein n=1 Tax=Lacimicrobium alkaliphilum TaxID=1526571 RepID=A0A0U2JIM4_9ALTE|nr:winged helix-turn-helix domain-containing protein [Lacimicrobium alkaliphilum]ALS97878.1 hypothetical protein AT746_06075 [Lacimicrobium alkaliphilum]